MGEFRIVQIPITTQKYAHETPILWRTHTVEITFVMNPEWSQVCPQLYREIRIRRVLFIIFVCLFVHRTLSERIQRKLIAKHGTPDPLNTRHVYTVYE